VSLQCCIVHHSCCRHVHHQQLMAARLPLQSMQPNMLGCWNSSPDSCCSRFYCTGEECSCPDIQSLTLAVTHSTQQQWRSQQQWRRQGSHISAWNSSALIAGAPARVRASAHGSRRSSSSTTSDRSSSLWAATPIWPKPGTAQMAGGSAAAGCQ
jgi:hypothetical protein